MENFRQTIRKRVIYFRILMLVAFVVLVGVGIWGYGQITPDGHFDDFSHGIQVGLAAGIFAGLIVRSRNYYKALKDETYLKKLYIEETDERYKKINLQVGNFGYYITLYAAIVVAFVFGFVNKQICIALIAVALFMITVRGILGIYYRNKY